MPDTAAVPWRFPTRWAIRIAGSVVVLCVTLWLLPTDQVWSAMLAMPAGWWVASLIVYLLGHAVAAMKWRAVLNIGQELTARQAVRAHFAGLAANLCLPGAASGDIVRAGMIMRSSQQQARIALGSLADRLLDVFSLFVLAGIGAAFSLRKESHAIEALFQVGVALIVIVGLAACGIVVVRRIRLPGKLGRIVAKVTGAIDGFLSEPRRLVRCFGMSLTVQLIFLGVNIGIASAMHVDVAANVWFMAWPLAKLVATVPVSAGGIGVREAALAALVVPFGAAPSQVVAVGLVWETVLIAGGLIGAGVVTFGSGQVAAKTAPR